MVHTLLLILKIIGLVLLILLALILILLLTVLFTPLRCTLKAGIDNSPESAQGNVRFHWLFHLISGEASWQDGELTWHFRAAWKKYSNADEPVPDPVKTEDPTPKRRKQLQPPHGKALLQTFLLKKRWILRTMTGRKNGIKSGRMTIEQEMSL